MTGAAQRSFTLDDYWAVESHSPLRHEYIDGAIYAMAVGTPRHNEIAANVQYALRRAFDDTDCRPVGSDQRIQISHDKYTYADVSLFCGKIEVAAGPPPDTATNPRVVVEVLSSSTRAYDEGEKRELYQTLPSVENIVLIDPQRVRVVVWTRADGSWDTLELTGRDEHAAVAGQSIALADIYAQTVT